MYSCGIELTFVPDLPGDKEFGNKNAAQIIADALLTNLTPLSSQLDAYSIDFIIKVDPFRSDDNGIKNAWIIEVTNGDRPTRTSQWKDKKFVSLIQKVFDQARKLKLYPRIRRRGIHHPSAACHLHIGIADLLPNDHYFLTNLTRLERNLYHDLANRPYIRWLFAEWFDANINSAATFHEGDYKAFGMSQLAEYAYSYGRTAASIAARYSYRYKPAYPTYEFRFFDSVDTAKELARNVKFLEAWMSYHANKALHKIDIPFTLTRSRFKALKNERNAWFVISTFLRELNLDPNDFRKPFEENYVLRMRHGEMT